jgi:hypothetical protein
MNTRPIVIGQEERADIVMYVIAPAIRDRAVVMAIDDLPKGDIWASRVRIAPKEHAQDQE